MDSSLSSAACIQCFAKSCGFSPTVLIPQLQYLSIQHHLCAGLSSLPLGVAVTKD